MEFLLKMGSGEWENRTGEIWKDSEVMGENLNLADVALKG